MRAHRIALFLLLVLLVWGCKEEDRYALRFNHHLHVEVNGLECKDCHGRGEKGRYQRPTHETCAECHSEIIETEKISEETCGTCHTEKDMENAGSNATRPETQAEEGHSVFFHSQALEESCAECHGNLLQKENKTWRPISREEVLQIRKVSHRSNRSCRDCHRGLDKGTRPRSHLDSWKARHGLESSAPEADCAVCHTRETCRECHQTEKPASHNLLWVEKSHGIEGAWDRQRCRTCHQDDFCIRCHSEVKPRSHSANWKRIHGRFPSQDSSSCRECHPVETCQSCHQNEKPLSHNASWGDLHCLACHQSGTDSAGCRVCHEGDVTAQHDVTIPHDPFGDPCLSCHDPVSGLPGRKLNPARHPFLVEGDCLSCHRY